MPAFLEMMPKALPIFLLVLIMNVMIGFSGCRYGHMIDNVVLIVTGTLHERDVQELLEKCHPLGMFDRSVLPPESPLGKCLSSEARGKPRFIGGCLQCWLGILRVALHAYAGHWPRSDDASSLSCSIATLAVAQNMRELYRLVLVDTPLAPYFSECITSEVNAHVQTSFAWSAVVQTLFCMVRCPCKL